MLCKGAAFTADLGIRLWVHFKGLLFSLAHVWQAGTASQSVPMTLQQRTPAWLTGEADKSLSIPGVYW